MVPTSLLTGPILFAITSFIINLVLASSTFSETTPPPTRLFISRHIIYPLASHAYTSDTPSLSFSMSEPFSRSSSFRKHHPPPQVLQIPLHQEHPLLQSQILLLQLRNACILIIDSILHHIIILNPAVIRVHHHHHSHRSRENISVGSTAGVTGEDDTSEAIPPNFLALMIKEVVFLGA